MTSRGKLGTIDGMYRPSVDKAAWLCALAVVLIAYEIREAKREIGRVADLTRRLADANADAVALRRRHVELLETMLKTKGAE